MCHIISTIISFLFFFYTNSMHLIIPFFWPFSAHVGSNSRSQSPCKPVTTWFLSWMFGGGGRTTRLVFSFSTCFDPQGETPHFKPPQKGGCLPYCLHFWQFNDEWYRTRFSESFLLVIVVADIYKKILSESGGVLFLYLSNSDSSLDFPEIAWDLEPQLWSLCCCYSCALVSYFTLISYLCMYFCIFELL